jgi:branched-chain amino acid transport system permease protein
MELAIVTAIHVMYAVASLFLVAAGLAVIFGMMGVINFAHGEFLMVGGFAFILAVRAGINTWLAMFVVAPLVCVALGGVVERFIIRHLYGRTVDTILATWGLSLLLVGIASVTLGYDQRGVSQPFGSVVIGDYLEGGYTFFVIGVAAAIMLVIHALLRWTSFGLVARGTMENAAMAAALGINVRRIYAMTFGLGAALSGVAGAVLAPIAGVMPVSGTIYIGKAFITVISGGPLPLAGSALAALLLGTVNELITIVSTPVVGEVALLATAIVLLRFLPSGITGRFFRGGV